MSDTEKGIGWEVTPSVSPAESSVYVTVTGMPGGWGSARLFLSTSEARGLASDLVAAAEWAEERAA